MWHVSDGDLHAYLDGALELYPGREAARIREHLDTCAACRQRLEEEAALSEEARRVLAGGAPPYVEGPPLELLKRRAEAERSSGRPGRAPAALRWAWAATVVLALGVGWGVGARPFGAGAGGAGEPTDGSRQELGRASSEAPPSTVAEAPAMGTGSAEPADEMAVRESPARGDGVAGARPASPEPAPASAPVALASAPSDEAAATFDELGTVAALPLPERRDPPGPLPVADVGLLVAQTLETPVRMSERPRPTEEEPSFARTREEAAFRSRATVGTTGASTASADPSPLSQMRAIRFPAAPQPPVQGAAGREERRTAREEIAAPDELFPTPRAPLSLPGVELRGVEWTELADGQPALLVLHRTEDDTPLELRFAGDWLGRGSADPAFDRGPVDAGPLPRGWSEVAAPFRGGWVLLRGPLAEASLRALLESAGVPPR